VQLVCFFREFCTSLWNVIIIFGLVFPGYSGFPQRDAFFLVLLFFGKGVTSTYVCLLVMTVNLRLRKITFSRGLPFPRPLPHSLGQWEEDTNRLNAPMPGSCGSPAITLIWFFAWNEDLQCLFYETIIVIIIIIMQTLTNSWFYSGSALCIERLSMVVLFLHVVDSSGTDVTASVFSQTFVRYTCLFHA